MKECYPDRKWLKSIPRTQFSQGALYEIGSALSFFQIRQFADEFLAALTGQFATEPPKEDETIAYVADEIEQTTRDYILKTLATELKGHALADFIAHLLGTMSYRSRVSPEGPDGGVDIIAQKDELGFEPPIIKVQVKAPRATLASRWFLNSMAKWTAPSSAWWQHLARSLRRPSVLPETKVTCD